MAKAIYNGIVRKYTPKALICDGRPIQKDTAKENLKIFIEFAQKYKLQYFLLYGSLLGAVRDKDFITYDEDIDLGLFTDDYALTQQKFMASWGGYPLQNLQMELKKPLTGI